MFETLVAKYGLLGIFLGAGIEGEAATIAGGILVHKGAISLWGAMLAAACGSCVVDQIFFFLGRHFRGYAWVDRMASKPAAEKALAFLERRPTAFILGFRFVYGMRTISPIVIGTSRVATAKFVLLNAIAAAIWGPLFIWIGYSFGKAIDPLMARLDHNLLLALAAAVVLVGIGGAIWFFGRQRGRA